MPMFEGSQTSIAYEQVGEGPDIVWVSGGGDAGDSWDTYQLPHFRRSFRNTKFTNRGIAPTTCRQPLPWTIGEAEIARPNFVAWYRNPGSATPASLRIAYENDAGEWQSVQPDFIVVARRDDGSLSASIVDPHGDHLADARGKLRALAAFADAHGDQFVRIESIARAGGGLRVLDLADAAVRAAVHRFEGAKVSGLYEDAIARPYP
jgi:hypothetical protein